MGTEKMMLACLILKKISIEFDIGQYELIYGRSRLKPVVESRQAAMYLLWNNGLSLKDIGGLLNRTPAAVSHGFQATSKRLKEGGSVACRISKIKAEVKFQCG